MIWIFFIDDFNSFFNKFDIYMRYQYSVFDFLNSTTRKIHQNETQLYQNKCHINN